VIVTLRTLRTFPLGVRLLVVNQFGVNAGFYLLVPYLAGYLGDSLGMSAAMVGLVLGVRNLSQQGLFLLGGTAADRLGPRTVIVAGCGLRAVGFALFAFGETVPVVLVAAVISGVAGALFNPAVRAYLADDAADQRAEAFSVFGVFAEAGALAGPLLGSLLLVLGFRWSAIVAAALFALLTVAQAALLPRRSVPTATTSALGGWRECLTHKRFVAFTLAMSGFFALQSQMYLLLPMQAGRVTGWDGAPALLFCASTLATLGLQVRLTRWLKGRVRRGRAIAAGLALMAVAFVLPLFSSVLGSEATTFERAVALVPVLLAVLVLSTGIMVAQPFAMELVPELGRPGLSGTYFGVFYLAAGVVAAAGNAVLGWASDGGSGAVHPRAWLLCLGLGLTGAVAVRWLDRRGTIRPHAGALEPQVA